MESQPYTGFSNRIKMSRYVRTSPENKAIKVQLMPCTETGLGTIQDTSGQRVEDVGEVLGKSLPGRIDYTG